MRSSDSRKEQRAAHRKGRANLAGPIPRAEIPTTAPEDLPLILDLAMELRNRGPLGDHIHIVSPSHGELAHFPWWDDAAKRLAQMTEAQIPAAGPAAHWSDQEQGWQLILERRSGQILVFERGRDRDTLDVAFRGPVETWKRAWSEAIARARR
jgi:hypothetical protein